jgi:hypothetical protein
MTFDQEQSSRLGQRTPPENPGIRIVSFATLPEVAYRGQIVYLTDLDYILIYDGDAWQAVGDGASGSGSRIFVSATDPVLATTVSNGDEWYNTTTQVLKLRNAGIWTDPKLVTGQADNIGITGAVIATIAGLGTPGVTGMEMLQDTAGGIIKWWTGNAAESGPGWINPYNVSGGGPAVEIASSGQSGFSRARITLYPGLTTFDQVVHVHDGIFINPDPTVLTGGIFINAHEISEQGDYLDLQVGGGPSSGGNAVRVATGSHISAKIGTDFTLADGVAVVFDTNKVIIGKQGYNSSGGPTAGNTQPLHCNEIHSWDQGIWMEDLNGGGTTGASIGNGGRIIRTVSSRRYKSNITPMPIETARTVLELEPVTYTLKEEHGEVGHRVYPGFIAEQADEVGAKLWVNYDTEGQPDGFRYDEVTSALVMLVKELTGRVEALEAQVQALQ